MKHFKPILLLFLVSVIGCKNNTESEGTKSPEEESVSSTQIEVQGHRGERGHYPENTIPGFLSAIKKGVDVIELDVVISKDNKVVVSHEPVMSSVYMRDPNGESISKAKESSYNLYKMEYDSIRKFDSGSRGNPRFPEQKKMKTYKPLLSEAIDSIENFLQRNKISPVKYNIEIKSVPSKYGEYQPEPEEFVNLVVEVIEEKGIADVANIQSFDPRPLNILKEKFPEMKIAYLVSDAGITDNLEKLNFTPDIYSPNYKLVANESFVDSIHNAGMKLIPWTVNDEEAIKRMIQLKVDGIITDYPERVLDRLE